MMMDPFACRMVIVFDAASTFVTMPEVEAAAPRVWLSPFPWNFAAASGLSFRWKPRGQELLFPDLTAFAGPGAGSAVSLDVAVRSLELLLLDLTVGVRTGWVPVVEPAAARSDELLLLDFTVAPALARDAGRSTSAQTNVAAKNRIFMGSPLSENSTPDRHRNRTSSSNAFSSRARNSRRFDGLAIRGSRLRLGHIRSLRQRHPLTVARAKTRAGAGDPFAAAARSVAKSVDPRERTGASSRARSPLLFAGGTYVSRAPGNTRSSGEPSSSGTFGSQPSTRLAA